jgi:Reverse transcriptase (RNA-dependent DNA polymerase)
MLNLNYTQSNADKCIFIRVTKTGEIHQVIVYVDDLGLVTNSKDGMALVKSELQNLFEMTDLGAMKKILGIKVWRDREAGILQLSQEAYIDLLLERFQMTNCNPTKTPLVKNSNCSLRLERLHQIFLMARLLVAYVFGHRYSS